MAFSGLHVSCGWAGAINARAASLPLLGKVEWSQQFTEPGTSAAMAPEGNNLTGDPMFQVRASADCFVAIGPMPNASTGPRIFVPAGERVEFYGQPGDKLAWVTA